MEKSSTAYIGMDVHKESIDVAIADVKEARHFGRIGGDAHSVDRASACHLCRTVTAWPSRTVTVSR